MWHWRLTHGTVPSNSTPYIRRLLLNPSPPAFYRVRSVSRGHIRVISVSTYFQAVVFVGLLYQIYEVGHQLPYSGMRIIMYSSTLRSIFIYLAVLLVGMYHYCVQIVDKTSDEADETMQEVDEDALEKIKVIVSPSLSPREKELLQSHVDMS